MRLDGYRRSSDASRKATNERREKLRAANKCVNGPLEGNVGRSGIVHGPVVKRGRCQRCLKMDRD